MSKITKIKMLQSIPGALNGGLNVKLFKKGLIYDVEDMEGIDQIFLDNKYAEVYIIPEEVIRHQKGLTGAITDKREIVPKNKKSENDPDNLSFDPDNLPFDLEDNLSDAYQSINPENKEKVIYTSEELEGAKAGDIRKLGKENDVDLSDLKVNASAKKLIEIYLERQ